MKADDEDDRQARRLHTELISELIEVRARMTRRALQPRPSERVVIPSREPAAADADGRARRPL